MKKKYLFPIATTIFLMTPMFCSLEVKAASEKTEELKQQEQELGKQSELLNEEIKSKEQEMESLEEKKEQIEGEVAGLQKDISTLIEKIKRKEEEMNQIEEEIKKLQKETVQLQDKINSRTARLESQARSVQTQANPQDIASLLASSENLSDFLGRINVIGQLMDANQDIMKTQIDDKRTLEDKERQYKNKQEKMQAIRNQLEVDQEKLSTQRSTLENKIIQIVEQYNLTATEREGIINEQTIIAKQTTALTQKIQEKNQKVQVEKKVQANKDLKTVNPPEPNNDKETNVNSRWILPANGIVTSRYGWRTHPVFGNQRFHKGIDIAGSGSIIASRSGKVITASYNNGLGYYIEIDHGDGYKSVYSHLQPNMLVSSGQEVAQGQPIGIMGTTGVSTGVHLDFQIYKNGSTVHPSQYLGI